MPFDPLADPEEKINHIIDQLNDAQRQAVCAPVDSNNLVLAGAGSGKTRVLIHRIAWLNQIENVSIYGILGVTFTNKAATEMRNRLGELLDVPLSGLWVGTFHGLAHRLLRLHWQEANLPQAFQILDGDDQYRFIRRVLKNLELDDKQFPPRQMQSYINKHKDAGIRPQHIEAGQNQYEKTCLQVYKQYQVVCQRGGLVDFAELLLRVYELWHSHPQILTHYQQRFSHILIDEFQDTNVLQYAWLRLLAGESGWAFAVGDDDQSIYGWRGARADNLQHFQNDFKPVNLVRLEQNYRSTATILSAANALIENNHNRLGKKLWTGGEQGVPISLYQAFNAEEEARFLVARIQDWKSKQDDHGYKQCAILYRSNAQSRAIEENLIRAQIPYQVYGGQRFFERAEVKDALAYLRLLLNKDDDSAFERVVNHPPRGIGERSQEQLRAIARQQGISLWQAATLAIEGEQLTGRSATVIQKFMDLIISLQGLTEDATLEEQTRQVVHNSGLWQYFKNKKTEKEQMRVENLEELISATAKYIGDEEQNLSPLQAFLSNTALDAGHSQQGAQQDSVQLMTLHTAKGLEFPLVFLCGMEENLFPHRMALQDSQGLEEERRLCYVGITRAMEQLYLCHAETRRLHGMENRSSPSRFLQEIPAELMENVRLSSVPLHQQYHPPGVQPRSDALDTGSLPLGQIVVHSKYGEGIVVAKEGKGIGERVQVMFYKAGSKWLVLKYARLEIK